MTVHQTPPTEAATRSLNDARPPDPPKSSRTRIGLIAAGGALTLAVLAVAAILVVGTSHPASQPSASAGAYQEKLSTGFAPLVPANLSLSSALQSVDGSKASLHQAQMATTAAQAAVSTVSGAVTILTVPSADTTLSQQTQQALVQEAGYLQGVSSTLSDPVGQSSSSLRSLATNTQAAFVLIASVAPGASTSISGTGNLLSWASGANANATKHKASPPAATTTTTTTTTAVAPAVTTPPVSGLGQSVSYCSTGVYVNSVTTCPFAENVFTAYFDQYSANGDSFGDYAVEATSPTTGDTYTDECQESADGSQIYCSHGTDLVNLTTAAISAY